MKPKVLTIITDGINCDRETSRAFELAGAVTETVHLNLLLDGSRSVSEFDIIAFSGGFSYGDDVKSGKIFSLKLLKLKNELDTFVESGRLMIGICNGFQVLTTLGIIPFNTPGIPGVSLYWNDSGRFECRWVDLKVSENHFSPWLKGMNGSIIKVQAAHAEGKLVFRSEEQMKDLISKGQAAFTYVDPSGNPTEDHPYNPNGSPGGIAGLTDTTGRVLGMMPHPERNCEKFQHPDFRNRDIEAEPDGLLIFKNALEYFRS